MNASLKNLQIKTKKNKILTRFFAVASNERTQTFNPEKANQLIENYIIANNRPFSTVDNKEFCEMINYFNRDFKPVCRQTFKKVLESQFLFKKDSLKKLIIKKGVKISLTADGWTSPVNETFLGITG